MKRRQFLGYAGVSAATVAASGFWNAVQAQSGGLSVTYLGHMCFLLSGSGQRVLVNPFKSLGCTAGYRPPNVSTDLVLISSQLLDEGAVDVVPGNPKLLYQSGAYEVSGLKIQGIDTDHDKVEGKRFGRNIAWKWNQGGISILHLGGAAAPISLEQKILMGTPDILFIPVGAGPKAYSPEDAKQAIGVLNPKLVVPTQYRTAAAKDQCDLVGLDSFLGLMGGTPVRKGGNSLSLGRGDIPKQMTIQVMNY
jgi:L-ascorbate metabolism protein UlaG (beta-lactamase superfamily)